MIKSRILKEALLKNDAVVKSVMTQGGHGPGQDSRFFKSYVSILKPLFLAGE